MDAIKSNLLKKVLDKATEAVIITSANGAVIYKNQAAVRLLASDDNLIRIFADQDINKNVILKAGEKILEIKSHDCQLDGSSVKVWYIGDISEEEAVNQKMRLLNAIIDSISEGVIASDLNGTVILYNKRLEKLEGRDRKQILGKHITEVYNVTPDSSEHLKVLELGKPITELNLNYFANNKEMQIVSSTFPLWENDSIISVYSVSRDITGIRQLLLRTINIQETRRKSDGKEILANGTTYTLTDIVSKSESFKQLIKEAQKAAISPSPVMLYGETGTGKELFVQGIHNAGANRKDPFVAINCAAIPESLLESLLFGTVKGAFTGAEDTKGLFEQAGKGTLYLDEINSMPVNLQPKILRVFQEKKLRRVGAHTEVPISCRIISSTNIDPWQCVESGMLRKDLYYRLAVIQIVLRPLRERIEDLEVLTNYFIKKYGRIYGKHNVTISENVLNVFKDYSWPGNVRELEHVIENSLAMMEEDENELTISGIPHPLLSRINNEYRNSVNDNLNMLSDILAEVEKKTILNSLKLHNWNITHAAEHIGIGRQNLQYRISKLGIKRPL